MTEKTEKLSFWCERPSVKSQPYKGKKKFLLPFVGELEGAKKFLIPEPQKLEEEKLSGRERALPPNEMERESPPRK